MKETYEFLKKSGVFYLATIDDDKPRVRPFGAINIFEDKLYIQTGKVKNVSKQIQINVRKIIVKISTLCYNKHKVLPCGGRLALYYRGTVTLC